jgi:hypothetical protein
LKILFSPYFEHKKIPVWKSFLKLGGGAVLLLWANTFSPFGMNRKNGYFEWNISPFMNYFLPLWQTNNMSEDYTKRRRDARSDDEGWVMEWSGSLVFAQDSFSLSIYDLAWNGLEETH